MRRSVPQAFEGQGDSTARSERLSIVEAFGSAFRQGAARADHAVWQRNLAFCLDVRDHLLRVRFVVHHEERQRSC